MKTPNVLALFIFAVSSIPAAAQNRFEYRYTNAANEHEQFILDIEKSLQPAIDNGPVVKLVKLSNGLTLEYSEQGDINGTPVVLLHGFPDSRCSYDPVLSHLSSSLHVFSVSQRGFGNSDKPEFGYTPKDMAADIAAFMDAVNIKQAVIVGHSMSRLIPPLHGIFNKVPL